MASRIAAGEEGAMKVLSERVLPAGPEVAHIASTHTPSGNTQSLDHLNFRLARKCSLTVDSKGRGHLAVTLSRSCDFLEPCPPVYERKAEKRSRSSVSGPEHLLLSSPPLSLLLLTMVAFVIQVLHCSEFHVFLDFCFLDYEKTDRGGGG